MRLFAVGTGYTLKRLLVGQEIFDQQVFWYFWERGNDSTANWASEGVGCVKLFIENITFQDITLALYYVIID